MDQNSSPFWSISSADLLNNLQTVSGGLTTNEAKKRLISYGANRLKPQKRSDTFTLLIAQFKSPIILILLFATVLSLFLHNIVDASFFLVFLLIRGFFVFGEESGASNGFDNLL